MRIPACPLCGADPEYMKNDLGVTEHRFQCNTFKCVASYLPHKISLSKEVAAALWTYWASTITHPAWLGIESAPKEPGERVLLLYPSLAIEVASWAGYCNAADPWLFDAAHRKPRRVFQPIRWAPLDPRVRQPTSHGAGVSK